MRNKLVLICIFFLAFFLRFYQLGSNPPSLDWDEAALGYNAYSILKSARDEYGSFLPLSIRSFNDYKPPLYTYLTTIPVYLFDLNEFSTRFVSAFLGTLTVIVSFFLIRQLIPKESNFFYLLFTFIFAISPWHIQFSRVAFETNTALFFMILGIYFFFRGMKSGNNYLYSMLSFGLSLYSYHSPRLIVPILIFGLLVLNRKKLKYQLRWVILSLSIFALLCLPLVKEFRGTTSARFGSVTRSFWATSIKIATTWWPITRCSRKSPAGTTRSKWAAASSTRGRTSRGSTSSAPTSKKRSAFSRAASGTGSTWPSCCGEVRTCCCSTNRPTTSTSTRSGRWKRR